MNEITDELEPHEQAFADEKAGRELFGIELRPYTPSRKVAAQAMGMTFPLVEVDEFKADGYPGFLLDVIIMTWLCSLPDDGKPWDPLRAARRPREAQSVAIEWAGEHGAADIASHAFAEASKVFFSIANAITASEFAVTVEGSGGGAEGGVPNV